ncbi:hypothetical protein A2819_00200 [Candidatus Azambacteria bacterium RIFCSPHIGHO2_01_FULL_40_24]|uniref:Uncharacterized protein n=1 Tax=Candidatus Azambacteria bacterium RIFCSPHIGHO2_01_FULL_40_24 TaxID=1797301 RepID=A0A1F5B3Z0_9BACT|nr:MAG: hypothetical protein A2819_00200 [Candidatus Azambacteria bacterium RIFCSPHIGHO2_01_FULL_40_24]
MPIPKSTVKVTLTFFIQKLLWITFTRFKRHFPDNLLTIHHASNITAAIPTNLPMVYGSLPNVEIEARVSGKARKRPARIMEAPNKILISIFSTLIIMFQFYHKIDN